MPHSPQAKEMADESMVRNLAHQAEAIWPQERALFARYGLSPGKRVLDVGCGTGEIIDRLDKEHPGLSFTGVDLEPAHLARARARLGAQVKLEVADALQLPFEAGAFDLTLSRHTLQAVPDAHRAVGEMARVTRKGGYLHVLAEDYGMLWCHPTASDSDGFWQALPQKYARAIGVDNHIGRKMFGIFCELDLQDVRADYVVVDTLRVPRETLAGIWEAWRDGYTEALVEHTPMPREEIERRWREMIACVRHPKGYALWQVPVWSARKA